MRLSNAQASLALLEEFDRHFKQFHRPGPAWPRRLKLQLGTNRQTDWMIGQLFGYYQGEDKDIASLFELSAWRVAYGKLVAHADVAHTVPTPKCDEAIARLSREQG